MTSPLATTAAHEERQRMLVALWGQDVEGDVAALAVTLQRLGFRLDTAPRSAVDVERHGRSYVARVADREFLLVPDEVPDTELRDQADALHAVLEARAHREGS